MEARGHGPCTAEATMRRSKGEGLGSGGMDFPISIIDPAIKQLRMRAEAEYIDCFQHAGWMALTALACRAAQYNHTEIRLQTDREA
jgi:hypothetical protein